MNTDSDIPDPIVHPPESQSTGLQQGFRNRVEDIKSKASDKLVTFEEEVRSSPEKSILIALGVGYGLHFLPKRSLIAAPFALAAFLAKPALLALGAYKACELIKKD